MTIDEASERYQIPIEILEEYERWGLCNAVKKVMGAWQYDDEDLENLSLIMTLRDIGFDSKEIETYMRLYLDKENTDKKRLKMLDKKRNQALDEIHFREKQVSNLDYLRYKITNKKNKGGKEL